MDLQEIKEMFMEEAIEYLEILKVNLNKMYESVNEIDNEIILETYRAAHSIKGTSGFLALEKIMSLSKAMENLLIKWRDKEEKPTELKIKILQEAYSLLQSLVENLDSDNQPDIVEIIEKLA